MFFRHKTDYKYFLFLLLAIFAVWAILQIKGTAMLFFGAFVIACSINPIVDKLSQKMSRAAATAIILTAMTVLMIVVLLPIGMTSVKELKSLFATVPEGLNSLLNWLNSTQIMGYKLSNIINSDTINFDSGTIASNILDKSYIITMGLIDAITVIFSIIMIVFYLVYEKKSINKSTLRLFPPKIKKRAALILTTIETKVGGYIIAQVLSMSTVAFFTVIGLMICGVKYALLLGIIAGILDIIPIVGPTIALLLGIAAALAKGWIWIFPTIAVYMIAQWISNQLVRPIVFGKFMQLHPLIVLFSFFIAAQFLGVWGVIIAPAIAATVVTLFDELYIKTINSKGSDDNE